MKHFTNLAEFISQLKVDSKIAIVEHKLINDKTDDTLYEGVITEVGQGYFFYKYKMPSAIINRSQLLNNAEIPWTGSHALLRKKESFCSIYQSNTYGKSSTILFKNCDTCYTFALHPDEPSCCPTCKGSGMNYTTISTLGEKEKQITINDCYDCKGKAVNKKEGKAIQKHIEELEALWCDCGEEDAYYVPDRRGQKHHWNCNICHKLKQMG